ncbi:MAG: hypothetical protein ACOH18_04335 [Candidatus Saccharimonadaceae bacterium]
MIKNNKRLLIFIAAVVVFIIAIIVVTFMYFNQKNSAQDDGIRINNYSNYVKNLSSSERKAIETTLYNTVLMNGSDAKKISTIKDAEIRSSSYQQSSKDNIYSTNFIVDIQSIKQSYKIEDRYSSQKREDSGLYDYTTLVLCLDKSDLIYGDFNCQDRESQENGVTQSDPILKYLPISSLDYTLSIDTNSKDLKLTAKLNLTSIDYKLGEQDAINHYKQEIKDWFTANSLDINSYSITYEY